MWNPTRRIAWICFALLPSGLPVLAQRTPAQPMRDETAGMQEDALLQLPPDLQGVMIALVRYQVIATDGYLHTVADGHPHAFPMPVYVSTNLPDGRQIDLSPEAIRRLADTGLRLFPGSAWPVGKSPPEATMMRMGVIFPVRRPDGDYDVQYGFGCGSLCGSSHKAVLRHDPKGWHVIRSYMEAID